ncbi:TPA: hypothetical protein TXJ16_001464 [Streptococcus suis]|nr:hypothetical protein [Streptococcus suis]
MFWLDPVSDYKILEQYVTLEDMKRSHFLIESEDVESFQAALRSYKTFLLDRGIPQMMKWLFATTNLTIEDLPYGYFCFEILSS